jgi:D-tyrosyl-tRNA(Tyr) deacylase
MRAVIQRVSEASVKIKDVTCGKIDKGLLVLLAIHAADTDKEIDWMIEKLINLRVFEDSQGKMNLSLSEIEGEMLIVSQFTLYGNCSNGRRPDFFQAAPPDFAEKMYNKFLEKIEKKIKNIQSGRFGADMQVALINNGPVTLIIDSK